MYSFPISFIGAVFYGITSIVSIDPTSIIANKNISIVINIYISVCSIVALFIWFNLSNPLLNAVAFNTKTVKTNYVQ